MKNIKFINTKIMILLGCVFMTIMSCERELSDEAVFATFPSTPEIFNDSPVGLGTDFYLPFLGSKPTAWTVDEEVSYEGSASMRFDVPNLNDPEGGYAGAIFRVDGAGRDLTKFDALTFWAKGSRGGNIGELGFGQDFGENKHQVSTSNLNITTNWVKYTIPIPDASKLFEERGVFWYSTATQNAGGFGWTFWIDDLKFEKLGTLAQPQPKMLNGVDVEETTFIGTNINLADRGLTQTYNLESGINQVVAAAPAYFTFSSTNPEVASVDEFGIVTVLGSGTTKITATMAGVEASGSLTIESIGSFQAAPTPTRSQQNVISIFSDAYTNVAVDYYNGFFTPDGQTTLGGAPPAALGTGQVINYTALNFVGIGFFNNVASVNATDMTHLHVDINVQEAVDSGDFIRIQLLNSVANNETSGAVTLNSSQLLSDQWVSLDLPLADFAGLGVRNELGLLFFISDSTISNIFVDNIYFYKE